MPTEVQVKRTRYARRDLFAAFSRAWAAVVGGEIPRAALALLGGQVTIETGWDGEYCWNNNPSNVMGTSPEGMFHVLKKAPECSINPHAIPGATVLESSQVVCPAGMSAYLPAGGSKFRAYSSLDLGCLDKLQVLKDIWPRAIEALAAATSPADAPTFVAGLLVDVNGHRRLYMTADPIQYARDDKSIAETLIRTTLLDDWPGYPEAEDPDTIPDSPLGTSKSSQRLKRTDAPIIDPGTRADDFRPQTSAADIGFLDSLVEEDKK